MINRTPLLAAVSLLWACTHSTPASEEPESGPQIDIPALRSHIDFLADDLLQGRATGTPGYDIAARYVASHFMRMGLDPAGDDGSWFQSFETVEESLVRGSAQLIIHRPGDDLVLVENKDFLIGGSYIDASNEITAPVVFAGFGVTAPELGYDDYEGLDVDGHIVATFGGAPPGFDHNQRAYYSTGQVKSGNAAARGAVARLGFITTDRLERYDWESRVKSFAFTGMRWINEEGKVQGMYPPISAGATLSPAAIDKLLVGSAVDQDTIQNNAAESVTGSAVLPVRMTIRRKSTQTRKRTANVAAILRGSDPALADEFVVMTAHLDHIGVGPEIDGDTIYNGAYDNAVGIAYLLEVARMMTESDTRPKRSVLFLAVSGEEKGLLGSDFFVENPTIPMDSVVGNVNLDMPLLIYPPADVVAFGAEHSSLESVVAAAAAENGFDLSPDPMPEEVIFVRSDQYPFVRKGVPAVFMVPGFTSADPDIDGREAFLHFLGNVYHTPADEIDLPFEEESAARFGQLNFDIVMAIANDPDPPRWNEGDFFGGKFGRESD